MEDALVEWDLTAGAVARTLPGARLEPLQFDPSGQFLAFAEGGALRVWLVEFGQIVPVTQGSEGGSRFLGWLSAGGGE